MGASEGARAESTAKEFHPFLTTRLLPVRVPSPWSTLTSLSHPHSARTRPPAVDWGLSAGLDRVRQRVVSEDLPPQRERPPSSSGPRGRSRVLSSHIPTPVPLETERLRRLGVKTVDTMPTYGWDTSRDFDEPYPLHGVRPESTRSSPRSRRSPGSGPPVHQQLVFRSWTRLLVIRSDYSGSRHLVGETEGRGSTSGSTGLRPSSPTGNRCTRPPKGRQWSSVLLVSGLRHRPSTTDPRQVWSHDLGHKTGDSPPPR